MKKEIRLQPGQKLQLIVSRDNVSDTAVNIIEDKQIDNKMFRRWITAQTFKMLDYGWDKYMRDFYGYSYQFEMLDREIKTLTKLEKKKDKSFNQRKLFFTKDVILALCNDYLKKFFDYYEFHQDKKGYIKLTKKYGTVSREEFSNIIGKIASTINLIKDSQSYEELYDAWKLFRRKMNRIPENTPKCKEWLQAYRGNGAYYTLQNMIMFHGVRYINGQTVTKSKDALFGLNVCLYSCQDSVWKLHYLLKETIEKTGFDLRESIESN